MQKFLYLSQFEEYFGRQRNDNISLEDDVRIYGFSPLKNTKEETISWSLDNNIDWADMRASVLICPTGTIAPESSEVILIHSEKPRKLFSKWLTFFVKSFESVIFGIEKTAVVHPESKVHETAYIGHFAVIEEGVVIGENSVIGHHSVIGSGTLIGKNVSIKPHCVIGEAGFGFEKDDWKVPMRIPHVGWVEISDYAEIGSFTTVCRGTLGATKIMNNAKVDDLVHLAHNVTIKERAMIVACAGIMGSTIVGEDTWIGGGSVLRDGITIGSDIIVGLGAVVTKDVLDGSIVVGNPAKPIKSNNH